MKLNQETTAVVEQTVKNFGQFLQASNNLSDVVDQVASRAHLGLGDAATHAASDFDPAGAAAAVQAGGGSAVSILSASLTSAQIKTLHATPVTVVPAQGAGTLIVPIWLVVDYQFNTVAYVGNLGPDLFWGDSTNPGAGIWAFDFPSASADMVAINAGVNLVQISGGVNFDNLANLPLVISGAGTELTTGNGTAKVYVAYMVLTK